MKKSKLLKLTTMMLASVLMLTACGGATTEIDKQEAAQQEVQVAEPTTVEITDINGTVTVPVNPKNVVALDNRTFETLSDWGIELAAVPKGVMPGDSPYVLDESVKDIGNHREPNLELLASVEPELVIVGQRFASFYEDIKAVVPNAVVINLNFDVSEKAENPGDSLVDGLKNSTIALGKIFDKNEEAAALIAEFDAAIDGAKKAYNGTDTVMSVIVSGGNIGFSAPRSGRVWGPMYEIFGWVSSLEVEGSSTDHQGDDISVEAIAQSNPDWLFVLDRDAGTASAAESTPAQDVIDNSPALQNIKAVTEEKILYAPVDTYTNESIQTYLELFGTLVDTLGK